MAGVSLVEYSCRQCNQSVQAFLYREIIDHLIFRAITSSAGCWVLMRVASLGVLMKLLAAMASSRALYQVASSLQA